MADTMTLEQVRDWLRAEAKTTNLVAVEARFNLFADAIDAAILERDSDRFTASNQTLRAQRAEAELAALKARIAKGPTAIVQGAPGAVKANFNGYGCFEYAAENLQPRLRGKRVRLVVEE